jgi:hypothetical protein
VVGLPSPPVLVGVATLGLGGKFGSGWTPVELLEVLDSGKAVSERDFRRIFGSDLPPLPTSSEAESSIPLLSDAQMLFAVLEGANLAEQAALYGLH